MCIYIQTTALRGRPSRYVKYVYLEILDTLPIHPSKQSTDQTNTHIYVYADQGEEMPPWLQRFTAEVLRFAEFERRVLPYQFMEPLPDGMFVAGCGFICIYSIYIYF